MLNGNSVGHEPHGSRPRSESSVATKDRQFVTALARGLDVLRCFRPAAELLGNQDLAKATGLPKPTVSRLTHTLCQLGYLAFDEHFGKYRLGSRMLAFGFPRTDARRIARPFMEAMARETGLTVALGCRDGLEIVYLECCKPDTTITLRLDVGSRAPLATTAMGRAYIAGAPAAERAELLMEIEAADRLAGPSVRHAIEQSLEDFAKEGYCRSVREWHPEVSGAGVPVLMADGSLLGLNCGGPAYLLESDRIEGEIGPRLVELARAINGSQLEKQKN